MMRRTIRFFLIALALPAAATAADLSLSLDGDVLYDSNVFRRENNVDDDVLFRIRPGIELHEDRGQDVNYSLQYVLPIQLSVDYGSRLNDIDQLVDGDLRYHANDRLDLFVSDNFRYLRTTVQQDLNPGSASGAVPNLSTRRNRVTLNFAQAGATYRFAPRLTGNLVGQHQYFNTTLVGRQENWAATGVADLEYTLNSRHILGLGARYIHSKFQASETFAASNSNTINGFASWRYQITETTAFSINAGPSYIYVNQDPVTSFTAQEAVPVIENGGDGVVINFATCPQNPNDPLNPLSRIFSAEDCTRVALASPGQRTIVDDENGLQGMPFSITDLNPSSSTANDLTVFGEVALSQRWTPNLASAIRYERSQGTASGLGGTVTVDAASLSTTWDFAERWQLAVRADWTYRKSVADVEQTFAVLKRLDIGSAPIYAAEFTGEAITGAPTRNRVETSRWGASGRLTHRLWRHTSLYGQFAFNRQNSKAGTLGGFSDFDDYMVSLGFRHEFDPFKVW